MRDTRRFLKGLPALLLMAMIVCAAGAIVLSQQVRPDVAKAQAAAARLKKTELKIGKARADGSYDWFSAQPIDQADVFQFQWTTAEPGVTAARWVVTPDRPFGTPGAIELKSAPVPRIPPTGQHATFAIDFRAFLPKQGPPPPNVAKYYVQIVPSAQGKDLAPSSTVLLTYSAAGPQTHFEENMGVSTPTMAEGLIDFTYQALKAGFFLEEATGPARTGPGLLAFRQFNSAFGLTTIEVTQVQPDPIIYVGAPIRNPMRGPTEAAAVIGHRWLMFTINRQTHALAVHSDSDQFLGSDQIPVLANPTDWAHDGSYDTIPGSDPPHWTPILITTDKAKIGEIHRRAQSYRPGYAPHTELLNSVREAVRGQDLTDRALENWQHVKLSGYISDAGFPDGDLGGDHAIGYNIGDFTPLGPPCEMSDPDIFPGMDWDLTVEPDNAYRYLASDVRASLKVEIEHFALGPRHYWPREEQYLQTIGRWVTDNGHDTYTEIHPPELLVSTQHAGEGFRYKVIVTGAWRGGELEFSVNPPPRPSPTAKMWYRVTKYDGTEGYDRRDNCELLPPEPRGAPGNPNHLVFRVRKTALATLVLHNSGVVGMTGDRGMLCVIQAGWDETIGSLQGTLRGPTGPAAGARVFLRPADGPDVTWKQYPVDGQGRYAISGLEIGKEYWVRPAGSGWDFANVPAKVRIGQGVTTLNLTASSERYLGILPIDIQTFAAFGRQPDSRDMRTLAGPLRLSKPSVAPAGMPEAASAARPKISLPVRFADVNAPYQMIRSMLVSTDEQAGVLGVAGNGMGYKDRGAVIFRLKGLVGPDGTPVKSLSAAFTTDKTASPPTVTVLGTPTSGVAGAKVRVALVLGNPLVGYHTVQQADVVTGVDGMAIAAFSAGRHSEEALLSFEILENPVNPWFLPKIKTGLRLFYPGQTGADGGVSPPYALRVTALRDGAGPEILSLLGEDGQEMIEAARFRRNRVASKPGKPPVARSRVSRDEGR